MFMAEASVTLRKIKKIAILVLNPKPNLNSNPNVNRNPNSKSSPNPNDKGVVNYSLV